METLIKNGQNTTLTQRIASIPSETVVVKIGTDALSNAEGLPDVTVLAPLCTQLAALKKAGHTVVLVTSGAVGVGRKLLGWDRAKKLTTCEKQVASKRGQVALMRLYGDMLRYEDLGVSQSLFVRSDFGTEETSPNEDMTAPLFLELSLPNVLPIVNENDGTASTEIRFSDNDDLAQRIATLIGATRLIILTSVEGVYDKDPAILGAKHIEIIDICNLSSMTPIDTNGKTSGGKGGMKGKLQAMARYLCGEAQKGERICDLTLSNIENYGWLHWPRAGYIVSSRAPDMILKIMTGEKVGTKLVCAPCPANTNDVLKRANCLCLSRT